MSTENQKTLAIYEKYADEYFAGDDRIEEHKPGHAKKKRAELKTYLEQVTAGMPKGSSFFEFGSANGDAVELFAELGYELQTSDAPASFIAVMREKGLNPLRFNVLEDEFPEAYDGVYSWRTLVHFTEEDAKQTFAKVFKALKPNGRYIFNVLNSAAHDDLDGQWFDFHGSYRMGVDRFFKYWVEDDLRKILGDTGFRILSLIKSGGEDNNRWYNVVAEKPRNGVRQNEKGKQKL